MKTPELEHEEMVAKAVIIYEHEHMIDLDDTLYLITWAPDPSEIPYADFETQHRFNINILADYLKHCRCGLFCVESTQKGNPHYHGWYQTFDDTRDRGRIVMVKVLERFGQLKITESRGHVKINSYVKHANCLYYYKDDLFGQMEWVHDNPIHKDSHCDEDWMSNLNFFSMHQKGHKQSVADLEKRVSDRDFYKKFFYDSKY